MCLSVFFSQATLDDPLLRKWLPSVVVVMDVVMVMVVFTVFVVVVVMEVVTGWL